ncbi:hypothetical protein BY996DRAFT_4604293 [Phakopsora pachyrhizi]|uniref:Uncharacterized protein n=1 Tax=Phakopsora pachyrhizi TaxID=170000 RepID=A0AAV0ATM7_PHAPC|nr:hypothetical protein BY996DRAFT_4604293 [Phakopsora pachyrhizi]CAH7672114.1 hypothetical protein PPACK8108_LOCUS6901 [Phakopsora pachyrhizi]
MIGQVLGLIVPISSLFGFSTTGIIHLGLDSLLVSVCLAGIRRSTGLTPALSKVQNKEVRRILKSYLDLGDWVMDFLIVAMGRSSSFERK